MYGQTGTRAILPARNSALVMQEKRSETRLPIVQMHQLRFPRQMKRQIRNRFREEYEPFSIVGVIDSIFLVKTGSLIEFWLVNEIHGQVGGGRKAPDFPPESLHAEWNMQRQV
jgi:hypothetical protein